MNKLIILIPVFTFLFACNSGKNESSTEKQDTASTEELQLPSPNGKLGINDLLGEQQTAKPAANPYKDAKIDIKVFNNDTVKNDPKLTGFGYDILIYDAVYNHQPHIPAINGMRGFHTKEQAKKAAELVVYKIRNNIMPPSLSPKELDSLGTLK